MLNHCAVITGLVALLAVNGLGVTAAVSTGTVWLTGVSTVAFLAVAFLLVRRVTHVLIQAPRNQKETPCPSATP